MFLLPAISYAQPVIEFDSESYNAGATAQDDIIEHTFEFSNKGDEALIIEKVTSSWGCTAVVASSSRLEPGETGNINAKVATKGKKGSISKSINVFSNDPKKPTVRLSIRTTID